MEKRTPTKEVPKKEELKQAVAKVPSIIKQAQPAKSSPKLEEAKAEKSLTKGVHSEKSILKPAKPMTSADVQAVIESLSKTVVEHTQQILELQEALARKRRPTANHKIRIKDKTTGKVYPSKNNAYQSLLKAGELKELVDKGVFGSDPAKNTFGWYALKREWPDRFEEVKLEQTKKQE